MSHVKIIGILNKYDFGNVPEHPKWSSLSRVRNFLYV